VAAEGCARRCYPGISEITGLGGNNLGYAFLRDVDLGPAGYLLQGHRRLHLSGQVRILELVRVTDARVRHQFEIGAAKRVTVAGAEIRERHPVRAADLGLQVMNLAGKAMRRKPLGHRVGIEKGPVDSFGRGTEHTVKSHGVRGHDGMAS
jgi:hypothetical protein